MLLGIIGLKYNKLDYVRQNNKIGLFWDNQHIEKSEPFRYFSLNNLEDIVSDYTFLQYSRFVFVLLESCVVEIRICLQQPTFLFF
jgi:hypothetical protein